MGRADAGLHNQGHLAAAPMESNMKPAKHHTNPRDDVASSLETGELPGKRYVRPPMPKFRFNHDDAVAMVAYLRSFASSSPRRSKPWPTPSGSRTKAA